ncbi:hypothetical protein [Streptomyces fradiae]|uniref:hypothetical protein n=1 Tax=Streptomyces fradiae TaxID=1906 RepID=UPI00381CB455
MTWASPFIVALVLLYSLYAFPHDYAYSRSALPYAPEVVSFALEVTYGIAYATVSCLGAWEAGRLRRDDVRHLAPVRSRYRTASALLFPVVVTGWLMLFLSIALALLQEGVVPTFDSLPLVAMAAGLVVAHSVIGFALGLFVPSLIASPVLAVGVFFTVSGAVATAEPWPRHMTGAYPAFLGYGELATWTSIAAHLMPTGGLAVGLALLWLARPGAPHWVRLTVPTLACVLVAASVLGAYRIVRDWGPQPPVSHARVAAFPSGEGP